MSAMEFDYVIVGAGAGGCALAGRLSEDPGVSICLLEAGGPDKSVLIHAPLGFAAGAPIGLNTARYETVPQPDPRGVRTPIGAVTHCDARWGGVKTWSRLTQRTAGVDVLLPFESAAANGTSERKAVLASGRN